VGCKVKLNFIKIGESVSRSPKILCFRGYLASARARDRPLSSACQAARPDPGRRRPRPKHTQAGDRTLAIDANYPKTRYTIKIAFYSNLANRRSPQFNRC